MAKRFLLLGLVAILLVTLCACGSKSGTVVTLDDDNQSITNEDHLTHSANVFSTRDYEEYLRFLTTFDSRRYEIIDISTGMYTYHYGDSYVITYTQRTDDSNEEAISYKYYLFQTRYQEEYLSFYEAFDFDKYEIVDISTRLYTYHYGESYMITYREPA